MNKEGILEGLLFVVGDEGLTLSQIEEILQISNEEAKNLLLSLKNRYESDMYGIKISFLADTFKLTTKKEHREYYQKLIENENNTLSQAALETLAIVAYNEPLTVQEIDEIRGINSREMVRRLVAKGLLKEDGKSDAVGRPILYRTTNEFLDYFGLSSVEQLPRFEEIKGEQEESDLYESKYKEE